MYERLFDKVSYNESTLYRFYRALVDVAGVDPEAADQIIEDIQNAGFVICERRPSWETTPQYTSRGSDV